MDFKRALERHLVFRTEYGAGPQFAGGLYNRRVLRRERIRLNGEREQDTIYEDVLKIGPVRVTHRSNNPGPLSGDERHLSLTLFGLIAISNDKDFLVVLKPGMKLRVLKTLLLATPWRVASEAIDLDVAGRAGFRLNVTRLLRDLRASEDDEETAEEPDVDLI